MRDLPFRLQKYRNQHGLSQIDKMQQQYRKTLTFPNPPNKQQLLELLTNKDGHASKQANPPLSPIIDPLMLSSSYISSVDDDTASVDGHHHSHHHHEPAPEKHGHTHDHHHHEEEEIVDLEVVAEHGHQHQH